MRKPLSFVAGAALILATVALAPAALAATDVTSATQSVTITVPARLAISIDTNTLTMDVDPADAGTHSVAAGAATVTVQSNAAATFMRISATQPTSGSNTIAFSNYQYKVSNVAAGPATPTVGAGTDWTDFSATPALTLSLNGQTDGTAATYDYRVARSWLYATGSYTSTVTYTIATL
jgi:hypothetical protein